ncbi:MAG: CBS domain-containing protein [Desulfobacteraceae bacterium]|nr:CBS domain-containing protein [Desulfobacteraceae bacterium]
MVGKAVFICMRCAADESRDGQTAEDAAAVMADDKVRRLVVVDEQENVVGIISLGDVAVKGTGRETAGAAIDKIFRPD